MSLPKSRRDFKRNREEVFWLLFVLLVGGVFSVTATLVYVRRLRLEAALGQFDVAFDLIWGIAALGLLVTLLYYLWTVIRFLRRTVSVDSAGVSVGGQRLPWESLVSLKEEQVQKRFYVFYRLELAQADGHFVPVSSAQISDYEGFRDCVVGARPDLDLEVQKH